MPGPYACPVLTFVRKTDKVDLVSAADQNELRLELERINNRLLNTIDSDGSQLSGPAFPSPSLPSQRFYRTDLDTDYIRNAANTQWVAQGTSLSNAIFNSTVQNVVVVAAFADKYFCKFTKISGINTLKLYARMAGLGSGAGRDTYARIDVNGIQATASSNGTAQTWSAAASIDVSGLTNGTTYDLVIALGYDVTAEVQNTTTAVAVIAS